MRQEEEPNLARNIAVVLVLSGSDRGCDQEQNEPRDPDFIEHFEVKDADPRVKFNSHEEVIERVARRAMRPAPHDGLYVDDEAVQEAGDDSYSHDWTELVDEGV